MLANICFSVYFISIEFGVVLNEGVDATRLMPDLGLDLSDHFFEIGGGEYDSEEERLLKLNSDILLLLLLRSLLENLSCFVGVDGAYHRKHFSSVPFENSITHNLYIHI